MFGRTRASRAGWLAFSLGFALWTIIVNVVLIWSLVVYDSALKEGRVPDTGTLSYLGYSLAWNADRLVDLEMLQSLTCLPLPASWFLLLVSSVRWFRGLGRTDPAIDPPG